MNDALDDRLRHVFADVFETTPDKISVDMSVSNVASWDSMQSIVIASSVEAEFVIELTDEELVTLDSFAKILAAIKRRDLQERRF